MGTILTGYGDAALEHEGYAAQVLDDGSITGSHNDQTRPRMIGQVVAACDCGWAGTTRYPTTTGPFDEQAETLALAEWETNHAVPAIADMRHQLAMALKQALRRFADLRIDPDRPTLDQVNEVLAALTRVMDQAGYLQEQLLASERAARSRGQLPLESGG